MGELVFIGLGCSRPEGISLEGLKAARSADRAFYEDYTSPVGQGVWEELESLLGRELIRASREMVEDGRAILEAAKDGMAVLISPGDPMIATTHMALRLMAIERGIKTRVIHAPSIETLLPSELGLHNYKFGKTVTITESAGTPVATAYYVLADNMMRGLHTTLLLEYDAEKETFLKPSRAMSLLLEAEESYREGILSQRTFVIVASRLGQKAQSLVGGPIGELLSLSYGEPPHTLVVPAKMHFTELSALKALLRREAWGNEPAIARREHKIVPSYVAKTRRALAKAKALLGDEGCKRLSSLLENVEAYCDDSERHLSNGRFELSLLAIGYAEGLLDSLRLSDRLDLVW